MNPYLLLPSLALSTSVIENTLYLTTIYFACKRMSLPHQHRLPISNVLLDYGHRKTSRITTFTSNFNSSISIKSIVCPADYLASPRETWVISCVAQVCTYPLVQLFPTFCPVPRLRWYPGWDFNSGFRRIKLVMENVGHRVSKDSFGGS